MPAALQLHGGRFSKAIIKLYGYVGMNPGHQLVMELNATHIQYTDMNALSLALPKRQLALSKSTAEQRLVWELLRVLDKAQQRERDQDTTRALRAMCDNALGAFTADLHEGAAIYERITREVTNQVAVQATQLAIRQGASGAEKGDGGFGSAHNLNTNIHNP